MPAARTALSCCLMLVLLLTLVAPGYAWASASAQAMHDHAGMSHAGDCPECAALASGDSLPVMHDDADCREAHESQQAHCCPGHVLGHLPASLPAEILLNPPLGQRTAWPSHAVRLTSHLPDGLERPPRTRAA